MYSKFPFKHFCGQKLTEKITKLWWGRCCHLQFFSFNHISSVFSVWNQLVDFFFPIKGHMLCCNHSLYMHIIYFLDFFSYLIMKSDSFWCTLGSWFYQFSITVYLTFCDLSLVSGMSHLIHHLWCAGPDGLFETKQHHWWQFLAIKIV